MNFSKKNHEPQKKDRYFVSKTTLTILALAVSTIVTAQSIYKSSIDSGGAGSSNGNIQIVSTIGEVNVQESSAGNIIISEGFVGKAFEVLIDSKIFLQGPLLNPAIPGLMNDNLRSLGYLPTNTPYSDGATVAASVFNTGGTSGSGLAQDDIVDWVWVELRGANDNTNLINEKSALLQRDGDIVALDGISDLVMTAAPTSYYVVVKHRNHLGVMTSTTFGLTEASATAVDLKSNGVATFGSNARVDMGSGNWALWAGDVNDNDQVRYLGPGNDTNSIKDAVLAHSGNMTNSNFYPYLGYDNADVNMNGQIRYLGPGNDTNILKDIILSHPSNGTLSNFFPFVIQVPN